MITRDQLRQHLEDFADEFRLVVIDELRESPRLFWSVMAILGLDVLAVIAFLWWLL